MHDLVGVMRMSMGSPLPFLSEVIVLPSNSSKWLVSIRDFLLVKLLTLTE